MEESLQTLHLALRVASKAGWCSTLCMLPCQASTGKAAGHLQEPSYSRPGSTVDWAEIWGSTLQGLHDVALHIRTTILSSALSNSPFNSAGECTCICTMRCLGPHMNGVCPHIENGGRCRFGQLCNTKLTILRFAEVPASLTMQNKKVV